MFIKRLIRLLCSLVAVCGAAIFVRAGSEWTLPLAPLKIGATALSPLTVAVGLIAARLALAQRDLKAAFWALWGGLCGLWYIRAVTRPHPGFEQAFGADWEAQVPAPLKERMLPTRYSPWWPALPANFQPDQVIGLHMETGGAILADLWKPHDPSQQTGAGIIYLHGSGWHYLKKDFYTRPFFRRLAGEGYVIADVSYAMAPKARLPEMLADVYRAIAWMKSHAAELGVDPNHIVLMGGSAGAHLALLAAYAAEAPGLKPADVHEDTSVCAVVSYYGPGDLRLAQEHLFSHYGRLGTRVNQADRALMALGGFIGRRIGFMPAESALSGAGTLIPAIFGGVPDEVPLLYSTASPITHIGPNSPPTLLIHGAHDFAIDAAQSRALYTSLRQAGVAAILHEIPYSDHVFDLFFSPIAPAFQTSTYDVERFLSLVTASPVK